MTTRFQDPGASVYDFGREFLVRCRRCECCAVVRVVEDLARLTCARCGSSESRTSRSSTVYNDARDWYFGLPLWLQIPCCGEVLWARNSEHLSFLEGYVDARIRERPRGATSTENKLLSSRLPPWIKRSSNRKQVLTALGKLRATLA